MTNLEIRSLAEPVEFRSEGTKLVAAGVAIRYGVPSKPMRVSGKRTFREVIQPGAATKALEVRGEDLYAVHEHDRRMMLGRVGAGTLRVEDTPTEMRYEIDLPDTTYGRDLAVSLERRDVTGSSHGFLSLPSAERWSVGEDGIALRSVGTLSLFDHISTTCAPAYAEASAELALRSLSDQTGHEIRSLVEAAEAGRLPELIDADPGEETDETETGDDGREITVIRRRLVA